MSENDGTGRRPGSGWDDGEDSCPAAENDLGTNSTGGRGRLLRMPWQHRPHNPPTPNSDGTDVEADNDPDISRGVSGRRSAASRRSPRIDSPSTDASEPLSGNASDWCPRTCPTPTTRTAWTVRRLSGWIRRPRSGRPGRTSPAATAAPGPAGLGEGPGRAALGRHLVGRSLLPRRRLPRRPPARLRRPARVPRPGRQRPDGAGGVPVGFDVEGLPVFLATVRGTTPRSTSSSPATDARVQTRSVLALAALTVSLVAVAAWWWTAPHWTHTPVLVALVAAFGLAGGVQDKPLVGPAVVAPKATRLSWHIVVRALASLGLAEINRAVAKAGLKGITFRPDHPGRARVARGRRPAVRRHRHGHHRAPRPARVRPAPPARLRLARARAPRARRTARPVGRGRGHGHRQASAWPAKSGTVDLFAAVPFGVDQRGRTVRVPVMYTNILIGAMPGYGKTFALRVLLLQQPSTSGATRCSSSRIRGPRPARQGRPRYASGVDETTIETVMAQLREVHADLAKRAAKIAGLPRDLAPENKVTRSSPAAPTSACTARRRDRRVPGAVHRPVHGKEAADLCTAIIKRAAPSASSCCLHPAPGQGLPVHRRLGERRRPVRDARHGPGRERHDPRHLRLPERRPRHRVHRPRPGHRLPARRVPEPQITRAAYLDDPGREDHPPRQGGPAPPAHSPGTPPARTTSPPQQPGRRPARRHPHRRPGRRGPHLVRDRRRPLGDLAPDTYADWNVEQLAAALKPYGIDTAQIGRRIDGKTVNRRGIDRPHHRRHRRA